MVFQELLKSKLLSENMADELKNLLSREEIASRISQLRNAGNLSLAIELCNEASKKFSDDYFFPQIVGDLYFQNGDYEAASQALVEFLKKLPSRLGLFGDFANRYYRLRRVWSRERISQYAASIMDEVQSGRLSKLIAVHCENLIKSDLPKDYSTGIKVSSEGNKLVALLSDDTHFNELAEQVKKLSTGNSLELEFILDQFILNRKRTLKTFRSDTFFISIYEKMGKHENALKIAEELLTLRLEVVVVRSIFRICRKMKIYERADKLLSRFPEILKIQDFNVLYELVYYFETQNNFEQIQVTLNKLEKFFAQSVPIQKTVRNFYIRFGLVDDAKRLEPYIGKLYKDERRDSSRFWDEAHESEVGIASKMQELQSEVEHQKQLAAISDLTTGISHELGQPITNIRYTVQFYSRLFEKKIEKDAVLNVFASILEETERMGALIKRLSPLTSSKSVVETFDLIDRIHRRIKVESVRLQKPRITVSVSPRSPVYLFGDPVKFDQLINNLLLNAIDAIRERKWSAPNRIDVYVTENAQEVKIVFTDTGVGISVKNRGKIFDPFFSTKAPGKGEGLGLFIVWNLLKMQGGKIRLDSEYKNGARFLISIPKQPQNSKEAIS